jgi:hypothetical protein
MQFSPSSRHFISLLSKYSPQHPVLKHPQSMFLNVRDKFSYPYRTTRKIIVLYILIFVFRQQMRKQKVLDQMATSNTLFQSDPNFLLNQILICCCYSKYINCDTFSKEN